ncbi:hypothetical protein FQN49_008943, partial [Arthroderma sp. PD_2]
MGNLAFTLGVKRSRHQHRISIVASNINELRVRLDDVSLGIERAIKAATRPNVCYAFTGQGAQWAGMGQELMSRYPIFMRSIQGSEGEINDVGAPWSLIEEIKKDKGLSRMHEAEFSQPCCTAVQIALVDLLHSWGVDPDFVCGHSSGEMAAAYAAGILTARDAIKVAYFRGRATMSPKARLSAGRMMAAGLSESSAQSYISSYTGQIVVACINSPLSVTFSGDAAALEKLKADLDKDDVFNRPLNVDVAYHSHHMVPIGEKYQMDIQDINPRPNKNAVTMVSSVTGEKVTGSDLGAEYWRRNLVSPVRFSDALKRILEEQPKGSTNPTLVIEVGPHPALQRPIMSIFDSSVALNSMGYLPSLSRSTNTIAEVVKLAGKLFSN